MTYQKIEINNNFASMTKEEFSAKKNEIYPDIQDLLVSKIVNLNPIDAMEMYYNIALGLITNSMVSIKHFTRLGERQVFAKTFDDIEKFYNLLKDRVESEKND